MDDKPKSVIKQEDGDKLVIIKEGEYKGYEGLVKKLASGETALLVLEKNNVQEGPVRIIKVIDWKDAPKTWPHDPSLH